MLGIDHRSSISHQNHPIHAESPYGTPKALASATRSKSSSFFPDLGERRTDCTEMLGKSAMKYLMLGEKVGKMLAEMGYGHFRKMRMMQCNALGHRGIRCLDKVWVVRLGKPFFASIAPASSVAHLGHRKVLPFSIALRWIAFSSPHRALVTKKAKKNTCIWNPHQDCTMKRQMIYCLSNIFQPFGESFGAIPA